MIQRIPEVSSKIKNGHLNLAQVSKLQKACRQIKKETGQAVSLSLQKEVLKKLEDQGALQSDLIIAQEFQLDIEAVEKSKVQADESVRVELTFTKDEMELIEKAQSLLSNKTGAGLKDSILEMAKSLIKQSNQKSRITKANGEKPTPFDSTATVAVKAAPKSITPRLKRIILNRDQSCQFKDRNTGKMCGSRKFLQIDHIQPRFADGSNETHNLRVLCANHNRYRYQVGL